MAKATPQQVLAKFNTDAVTLLKSARPKTLNIIIDGNKMASLTHTHEWTVPAIRFLSARIVRDVIANQMRLNNPPIEYLVDGSPSKPVTQVNKRIDVYFGGGVNSRPAMNLLMKEARSRMPMGNWGWVARAGPGNDAGKLRKSLSGQGPVYLEYSDRLYLVQHSTKSVPDATYANILFKNGVGTDGRGRSASARAKKKNGTAAQTTNAFRRNIASNGFYARSFQTIQFSKRSRVLPRGTAVGQRSNRISRFTGKPTYFQGAFYFVFMRARGRPVRRR